MNALPSSAYETSFPICHATVPRSPFFDVTFRGPAFIRRNAPVPYVHFASPSAKHACPKSALC